MNAYGILIFLHVLGAVGMFASWTIEALAHAQLGATGTAAAIQPWRAMRRVAAKLGGASMIGAILTGIVMMRMSGGAPWMFAAIAELVLIVAVAVVVERQIAPVLRAAAAGSPHDLALISRAMSVSLRFRVVTGVTIVALMTLKPDTTGALALIAAGIVTGFAVASRAAGKGEPTAAA